MQNGFARELARYGPGQWYGPVTSSEARRYCGRLARRHYENFTVASVLLPRRLQPHFHAVYAYCRWADDLADETTGGTRALSLLRWWKHELLDCYEGKPRHPVMVALTDAIQRFHIPREPFLSLLFAFEQDQIVKRYRSYEQLLAYCRNSANPVGHLVLYLCESFTRDNALLSDSICTALQLANFWQDIARDLDIGRMYLPEDDCGHFGYSSNEFERRMYTPAFADLLRFQVERTRDLFYRGLPLVDRVPKEIRPDIELFVRGGLSILRKIERCRYNVWLARPELAKWEKAALLAGAVWRKVNSALF